MSLDLAELVTRYKRLSCRWSKHNLRISQQVRTDTTTSCLSWDPPLSGAMVIVIGDLGMGVWVDRGRSFVQQRHLTAIRGGPPFYLYFITTDSLPPWLAELKRIFRLKLKKVLSIISREQTFSSCFLYFCLPPHCTVPCNVTNKGSVRPENVKSKKTRTIWDKRQP